MFKRSALFTAIGVALALPCAPTLSKEVSIGGYSFDINGYLRNRTAFDLGGGQYTGEAETTKDTSSDHPTVMMFENAARAFLNGKLGTDSSWHLDLNLIYDTQGVNNYWRGHENYTQYDYFREGYVDSKLGPVDLRLGKQQLVWGTADGIKLLDIINPTDYRHFSQDAMEESRIPVWMAVGEANVGSNGSLQGVIAQAKPNIIPGLRKDDRAEREVIYNNPLGFGPGGPGSVPPTPSNNSLLFGTDSGHAFIMKGVDTITGEVNGFANIGAAMGAVTRTFYGNGTTNTFTNPLGGANPYYPEFATVGLFTSLPGSQLPSACGPVENGAACLNNFTQLTNQNITNLIDANPITGAGWDVNRPNSTWEYMPNATFATFTAFTGMTTRYKVQTPAEANFGLRYKGNLDNGLNFSLNYLNALDPNPAVQIHWADPNTGEKLQLVDATYTTPGLNVPTHTLQLKNSAGQFYGAPSVQYSPIGKAAGLTDVTPGVNWAGTGPQMVFQQDLNRVNNIGASFDYAWDLEVGDAPVVLRGEFLYQTDVLSPVIDRYKLSYGDLTGALRMEKGDYFKYVLGADFTFFTNLMVSGQFIQFRNLDYVDQTEYVDPTTGLSFHKYTADPAVMHLDNGLRRGYEAKEFYSLFFSKPFGPSQEHRWNNITIFEEGGGWWNRFTLEYTFRDDLLGTFEWNQYWGNENTTFGQFNNSSSVMVGVKWLFE